MGSNYVGEFVAQEEREAVEEKEWREKEGEVIPPWMDEEKITADEYEGEYRGRLRTGIGQKDKSLVKLYVPRDREAHNVIVVGATGTRKSSILLGLADQAIARGWPCIFTDLKGGRSYVSEYYKPDVDYLINFADARCARWMLHQEFTSRLEAKTVAHAIIKDRENSIPFFLDGARGNAGVFVGVPPFARS
jgi:predicted alpha/beta-fold hydrolase